MRKAVGVLVVCLLCGLGAVAQDAPKADAYLGYSYLRSNYGNGISGYNQNGGVGQVAVYPSRWFGGVAEFSGFAVGNINSLPASGSMYTYLFGPRIRATHTGPLHPYVQALFGGAHISSDLQTTLGSTTRNGFAMALGGGLDLSVLPHIAIRLGQVDYLMTRFATPAGNRAAQNDIRYSGGVVLRF